MEAVKPSKHELRQVYYISQEIRNLQRVIEEAREIGVKSQSIDGMPHSVTNTINVPTEDEALRIVSLMEQVEQLKDRCMREKEKIMHYILKMDDSRMRQIVLLRCIELRSWKDVAEHLGAGITAETCRQAFNREFR